MAESRVENTCITLTPLWVPENVNFFGLFVYQVLLRFDDFREQFYFSKFGEVGAQI